MKNRKEDCECLPWLDKLRLLHEEGKIEEFIIFYKQTGEKKPKVLLHRPRPRFMLENAGWLIEEALDDKYT